MRRMWIAVVVVLVAVVSAPLSAELRFTSKMTARAVAGGAPATGLLAGMGDMVTQMIQEQFGGPEGVESVTTVHEDGRTRIEYSKAFGGFPAGTVMLTRVDGTMVGFDPKAKTWWKMNDPSADPEAAKEMANMMAQMKPVITSKRTGMFEMLSGFRTEKVTMNMRMPVPMPEGVDLSMLPPELLAMIPKEVVVDGDMWMAPAFPKYSKIGAGMMSAGPLAELGLDKFMTGDMEGFLMRSIVRTSVPAAFELETVVLKVAEEDVPDSVFEVPAGFTEVPMPGGR